MTIVEIFLFILIVGALTYLLSPLRRRIESYLYRRLLSGKGGKQDLRDVIDVTDYSKKDKPK